MIITVRDQMAKGKVKSGAKSKTKKAVRKVKISKTKKSAKTSAKDQDSFASLLQHVEKMPISQYSPYDFDGYC